METLDPYEGESRTLARFSAALTVIEECLEMTKNDVAGPQWSGRRMIEVSLVKPPQGAAAPQGTESPWKDCSDLPIRSPPANTQSFLLDSSNIDLPDLSVHFHF